MSFYSNKSVLITGGAGFVGSNLAHLLVKEGARVTILDNFHRDYGANLYNLQSIESRISLVRDDILNKEVVTKLVNENEVIFHLAAQCSHVDSMIDPFYDLEVNCKGTLNLLEAAKTATNKPSIIYIGTRAIVGAPFEVPAAEGVRPNPVDVYGVNKHAAELYGAVYARVHRIPFVSLRLTNCFGPRHQMKHGKYGILNWFISQALQDKPIKIFGTGVQLRDYLYIEDAAEAFLKAGEFSNRLSSEGKISPQIQLTGEEIPYAVFNIGSGIGLPFVDCARSIGQFLPSSKIDFVEWPKERKAIETGDFVSENSAAKKYLGWSARTGFKEGLASTIGFYQENLRHYL